MLLSELPLISAGSVTGFKAAAPLTRTWTPLVAVQGRAAAETGAGRAGDQQRQSERWTTDTTQTCRSGNERLHTRKATPGWTWKRRQTEVHRNDHANVHAGCEGNQHVPILSLISPLLSQQRLVNTSPYEA